MNSVFIKWQGLRYQLSLFARNVMKFLDFPFFYNSESLEQQGFEVSFMNQILLQIFRNC